MDEKTKQIFQWYYSRVPEWLEECLSDCSEAMEGETEMSDIELKPCPFCGAGAWVYHRTYPNGDRTYVVDCIHDSDCYLNHSISVDFETEEEAAEAWNRRADNG